MGATVERREEPADPFAIDRDRLVEEWLSQPRLTRDAGRREADARLEHSRAKAFADVTAARLKSMIRKVPSRHGLPDRPTIGQVDDALSMLPEYQEAVEAVNVAKRDLDYATADTTAFLDRRKALERLVELLNLSYWSEKDPRANTPQAREGMENRRRHALRGGSDD